MALPYRQKTMVKILAIGHCFFFTQLDDDVANLRRRPKIFGKVIQKIVIQHCTCGIYWDLDLNLVFFLICKITHLQKIEMRPTGWTFTKLSLGTVY